MNTSIGILALLAALAAPCAVQAAGEFDGHWEGTGTQDNGTSWAVRLTVGAGGGAKVDYPSLGCAGRLKTLGRSPGRIDMRETLTRGHQQCVDGGKAVLQRTGDNAAVFIWFYPDGRLGATGNLVREAR